MRKVLFAILVIAVLLGVYRFGLYLLPPFMQSFSPVVALSTTPARSEIGSNLNERRPYATPTVAALFQARTMTPARGIKTTDDASTIEAGNPTSNQAESVPTNEDSSLTSVTDQDRYQEVVIYDDTLNADWTLAGSNGVLYIVGDNSYQQIPFTDDNTVNSGTATIAVSPNQDYGTLLFTVQPNSSRTYRRDEVIGISFWLGSGNALIEPDDLAVSVVGNNTQPYWSGTLAPIAEDEQLEFSETRLYYLEINRSIPPNTWVNIIVWLDKLIYDPPYTYVTGFYIKNDFDIRNRYYVDQVSLLMRNRP